MFGKFFGKEKTGKGSIETILNAAKMMGFDLPKMAEEKIPELVAGAMAFQDKAGFPLFITIALDEETPHFILGLYKMTDEGADILKSYKLENLQSFISQLQLDLNNITDDTITLEAQQLTGESTGATTTDTNDTTGNTVTGAGTGAEL